MSTPLVFWAAAWEGGGWVEEEEAVTVVEGRPTRSRSVARGTSSYNAPMFRLAKPHYYSSCLPLVDYSHPTEP